MSNNLLIVESENDKFFIERLRNEIVSAHFDIAAPICLISEYECLDGLSQKRLEEKLREIQRDIGKRGLDKVGILLDADHVGIEQRVELINSAVKCIDTGKKKSAPAKNAIRRRACKKIFGIFHTLL